MVPSDAEQNLVNISADAGRWEAVLLTQVRCRVK